MQARDHPTRGGNETFGRRLFAAQVDQRPLQAKVYRRLGQWAGRQRIDKEVGARERASALYIVAEIGQVRLLAAIQVCAQQTYILFPVPGVFQPGIAHRQRCHITGSLRHRLEPAEVFHGISKEPIFLTEAAQGRARGIFNRKA